MEPSGLCPHSCLAASKFSYYLKKQEQGSLRGPTRSSSWHGCWSFEVRGSQNPAAHLCSPRGTGPLGTRSSVGSACTPLLAWQSRLQGAGTPLTPMPIRESFLCDQTPPCLLASQPAILHPCSALWRLFCLVLPALSSLCSSISTVWLE